MQALTSAGERTVGVGEAWREAYRGKDWGDGQLYSLWLLIAAGLAALLPVPDADLSGWLRVARMVIYS